jgi:hypothetical protein
MDITITINTDNAAFDGDLTWELRRVLEHSLDMIICMAADGLDSPRNLYDINGNTCGDVTITDS